MGYEKDAIIRVKNNASHELTRQAFIIFILLSCAAYTKPLPRFPEGAVWHRNIKNAPLAVDSTSMINTLNMLGGWGNGNKFQIDFSFHVLHADASAPKYPVIPWPNQASYYLPDCNQPGFIIPLPTNGAIEGMTNYTCSQSQYDCHLLLVQDHMLYEVYQANLASSGLEAQCVVTWDLSKIYPPQGRGEHCTTADAAGFPIAPLLFNADEIAAALLWPDSDLGHAIRFILPNSRIATSQYVHPSTHGTVATSGPLNSVPYGVRMRLKANFDMSSYSPAAQVILRTMQRYGVVLADGGNIALTAESDKYTNKKWNELGITSMTFVNGPRPIQVTDFEIIETGNRRTVTFNCIRTAEDFIFIDYFDY